MRALILLASAMLALPALAQTPGSCEGGAAQRFLDLANVQASLFPNGNLFFGGSTTSADGYLVPKAAGTSPMFAAGIWLSGRVNDEIRVSAARYGSWKFHPGPLNDDGTLPNPSDCSAYDRIWVVSVLDLDAYEAGGSPARDLAEWPVGLGAPTVDTDGNPVEATNREQVIDLAAGERPDLYGSQMAFWVMNDVAPKRNEGRDSDPLGVEVQVTAFVTSNDELAGAIDASFYRFRILNRSTNTIENARWSFFSDPDLGDAGDDFVGTDTTRGLAFVYNDSNEDLTYGSPPPAFGYDILNHELAATSTFIGGGPDGTQDPATAERYYNTMQGLWPGGQPVYEHGSGFEQSGNTDATTTFFYAGDPVTESYWSEVNVDGNGADTPQGDRRLVATTVLGTLPPGDSAVVDLALLYARGGNYLDSITELRLVSDGTQTAYDAGTLFQRGATVEILAAPQLLAPAEEADLVRADTITFSWSPVEGAVEYGLQWYTEGLNGTSGYRAFSGTSASISVRDLAKTAGVHTVQWKVSGTAPSAIGSASEIRSLTVFRSGPLSLVGRPAYTEAAGPDGADPCGDDASSRGGCLEFGENSVYLSLNSTRSYFLLDAPDGPESEASLGAYGPHDFEIRFTETGSLAAFLTEDETVIPVPFEVWDVGPLTPGEPNDPDDDVRLIPVLFADNGGTCDFAYGEIEEASPFGYPATDRIFAHYPATSYAAFEAAFAERVSTAPEMCFGADTESLRSFLYPTDLAPPIQNLIIGDFEGAGVLPGTGTVIRLYTADPPFVAPFPIADEDAPQSGDLVLGTASPNPTTSSLTVPYALARPSEVELAIYDVLGRRVVELANARQPEGAHTATLDASALAPGIYVVRLRAGEETRTTRITVVR